MKVSMTIKKIVVGHDMIYYVSCLYYIVYNTMQWCVGNERMCFPFTEVEKTTVLFERRLYLLEDIYKTHTIRFTIKS